jgi:hypothetical protein
MNRCKSISEDGEQCDMSEEHFGPHSIGDRYNPIKKWVTKCSNECTYHYNSCADSTGGRKKWLECIYCGHTKEYCIENDREGKKI